MLQLDITGKVQCVRACLLERRLHKQRKFCSTACEQVAQLVLLLLGASCTRHRMPKSKVLFQKLGGYQREESFTAGTQINVRCRAN